ncbi:class I SAM-dependent methyltransferase [Candidatus Bathyarchaeota archaeon]|nr:class I SAM-dependent methyltransferase [Candidatus Bathyarchaeota archaeon]
MSGHNHRCHGGFSLDEKTRREWYNPDAVLATLRQGMVFVDVGCGDGYFSILAAEKVGSEGKVYAVDIDESRIKLLKEKAQTQRLDNIVAVAARAEETVFCEGCADIVLYSMDLHDFDDPEQVIANANTMLKPGGKVIDLDWKKMQMDFGPPYEVRFSEQKAKDMLQNAGFTAEAVEAGPYHYIVTATKR